MALFPAAGVADPGRFQVSAVEGGRLLRQWVFSCIRLVYYHTTLSLTRRTQLTRYIIEPTFSSSVRGVVAGTFSLKAW